MSSSLPTPGSLRERVQPTLGFPRPTPTSGPLPFPGYGWPRTRPTPDTRISLVEKRVMPDIVFAHVPRHVVTRPCRERMHLHHRIVILDGPNAGSRRRLITTNRAHPRVIRRQRPTHRLDLPRLTARVRVGHIQRPDVPRGPEGHDMKSVPLD